MKEMKDNMEDKRSKLITTMDPSGTAKSNGVPIMMDRQVDLNAITEMVATVGP